MSSARTSSGSDQTVLPASRVTTALSSVSTVSLPGPTHTPSQTPVIAGSLTGVIVLVVCLVTLLLLHKRRRRLCTGCIRRATQQDSSSQNFSSNHLHKFHSLNGFEESLPSHTHDSTSSSGSFTVPSFAHPRLPNDNLSAHLARLHSRPASLNHNVHDPHDLPQPLALSIIRSPSSGIRSPSVPSQPHEASKSAACTQPSVNVSPMTSGRVGCHCGTALDADNSDAIFSNSNYSDVRGVTRQGSTVLLATRDVEQEEQVRLGNHGDTRRGTVDEPLPTAVNVADQIHNEHGNEGERNVILSTSGGYIHSQVYMSSGHRRRLEIPVLTASENAELSPQDRRGDSDGMEIAADPAASNQPITMGSPESSHPSLGPVVPALSASSLLHSDVPGQFIQGHDSEDQEIIANSINTQIAPSVRLMENRSYLGDTQHTQVSITLSCSGAGQPSIEEDAPPAYENAWAAARAVVTERRRAERSESRIL